MRECPVITVAIPTLGRPLSAIRAVDSIADQRCREPFEILVLDNGCDRDLAEAVRRVEARASVPVEYVPVPAVGLHNARHEAARRGRGEILAYVDDDVVAEPGWLGAISDCFLDAGVHMVGGRCLPVYAAEPPPWLDAFATRNEDGTWWCGPLTLIDLGPVKRDVDPLLVWGANFAIRKDALVRVGGFHPDGVPWTLRRFRGDGETAVSLAVKALGLRAAYSPQATIHHYVSRERLTEEYFERRAHLQGISDSFAACRLPRKSSSVEARKSALAGILRRLRSAVARGRRRGGMPGDWLERRQRAVEAHDAGYAYHQHQMVIDPAVQRWVDRTDYWAATIPAMGAAVASEG